METTSPVRAKVVVSASVLFRPVVDEVTESVTRSPVTVPSATVDIVGQAAVPLTVGVVHVTVASETNRH